MKPAPFTYRRPATLEEAIDALSGEPDAKVLAGGQSLVPLLTMRLAAPSLLVDINALPDLDHVRVDGDGNGVRIGALARHSAVLASEEAARVQPLLRMALSHVAHATIRNRGTTVGSLVHADAASELPMVLRLLDGSVEVAGPAGRRTIPAGELFVGPLESSLGADEIAVEAFFPVLPAGAGVGFAEVARRHGDYALCGGGAFVRREDGRVVEARTGYFSVCDAPVVVELTGVLARHDGEEALAAAGEEALAHLDPQTDIHASADYRAQLVRILTGRALRQALDMAANPEWGTDA